MARDLPITPQEDFTWIKCPHCTSNILKNMGEAINVELPCNSCKGIYHIVGSGSSISFTTIREPKRSRLRPPKSGQYPTNTK